MAAKGLTRFSGQPFFALSSGKLKHTGIKLIILALLGDEGIVVAPLDDAAVFQDHDGLGIADGGTAVSVGVTAHTDCVKKTFCESC